MNLIEKDMSFKGHDFKIFCIMERSTIQDVSIEAGDHPTYHGYIDEESTRNALWNIESGDIVLDVGAQYGSYAITALACGAEKIFAWSPQEHGFLTEKIIFEKTLELNGWSEKGTVYDCGVYDKNGWLDVLTQNFYADKPDLNANIIRVEILDDWYENNKTDLINKRVWMKLDVEAAEIEVLNGAKKLISEIQPIIFIENHDCLVPGIGARFKKMMEDDFDYYEENCMLYINRTHSIFRKK